MRFVKQSFLGIELDILLGHPEHDLLFIATQVARAAGLKNPKWFTQMGKSIEGTVQGRQVESLVRDSRTLDSLKAVGNRWRDAWLFPEPVVYQMLLRGHAPQSEPFRKWVTEEVLPSIRKTGTYDLFASETKEAQQFAGDFAALHAKIEGLEAKLDAVLKAVSAPAAPIVSPYEGQPGVALCDPAGFDVRTYRELGGELLSRPALDKLEPSIPRHMDIVLEKRWDAKDS